MTYFVEPFGNAGILGVIPVLAASDGSVSYEQGFTNLYQLNLVTDPSALPVPMPQFNQLMFSVTTEIQQYQQMGVPNFITDVENLGVPYPYAQFATVYYEGSIYQSRAINNNLLPTDYSTWSLVSYLNDAGVIVDGIITAPGVDLADVVYYDAVNSRYDKALADGSEKQNALGVIDQLIPNRLWLSGQIAFTFGSLVSGSTYYLSSTLPGQVSITPSSVKMGVATSYSIMIVSITQGAGWNTGDQKTTYNPNAEVGWIIKQNGTIGNAASGASIRANADTVFLFSLLWNSTLDANCPVSGGRGAGAAADFAANKTIALPVSDGTVDVNIGTSSYVLGQAFGEAEHTLTIPEIPAHTHGTQIPANNNKSGTNDPAQCATQAADTDSTGGGLPHNNIQPSTGVWMKIKL